MPSGTQSRGFQSLESPTDAAALLAPSPPPPEGSTPSPHPRRGGSAATGAEGYGGGGSDHCSEESSPRKGTSWRHQPPLAGVSTPEPTSTTPIFHQPPEISVQRQIPPTYQSSAPITRRHLIAAGLGLAALPLLAGCGAGGASAPPVTLRVHLNLTAYERSVFVRAVLPPFEAEQDARVELTDGTTDEAIGALGNDNGALDLLSVDTEALGGLLAGKLASAVDSERAALANEVVPSVLGALEANGALYALPYRPTTWITYYNTALFGAARLDPPRTWDELLAAASTLRAQDGGGLIELQGATSATAGGPAAQQFAELIWAFGGDPLTPTDDGARAAGAFLARLGPQLSVGSRDAKIDTMARDLATNAAALGPNWPSVATDLLQRGGKTDLSVAPTIGGPAGGPRVLSGQILVVPTGARQRRLALAFAAHLRSRSMQETFARELAWLPAREDAFFAAPTWQRGVAAAALAALRDARALPPLADRVGFDTALGDAFRQIAFEGTDPDTALTTATGKLASVR